MSSAETSKFWEPIGDSTDEWYMLETPMADFLYALREKGFEPLEVLRIDLGAAFYGGWAWKPGESTGSELSLYVLAELTDDTWMALEAWNDYTGWGCMDGVDVTTWTSREAAIQRGLSQSGRIALGLEDEPTC